MNSDLKKVYVLCHFSKLSAERKIIGVFTKKKLAMEKKEEMKELPGFREERRGFYIDNYLLNATYWRSGFFRDKI